MMKKFNYVVRNGNKIILILEDLKEKKEAKDNISNEIKSAYIWTYTWT